MSLTWTSKRPPRRQPTLPARAVVYGEPSNLEHLLDWYPCCVECCAQDCAETGQLHLIACEHQRLPEYR